ncbi:hypothetical protein PPERSA_10608 [Pseudocohnilembus persalinus]|uniref:Pectinacetylesterase family protein n=1 Tax=Pseudocohnilembus persalinus TaxID=266149 RepID=A0A0V0R1D7_PSEPJ|nr:hypothetical protein PPERSA_10608 [Pseudocohnilembus persalinus]|eukprot:KRX07973.1 hypothetical protein PPERSA_10608 [Pseudocohnilembus persalinus]
MLISQNYYINNNNHNVNLVNQFKSKQSSSITSNPNYSLNDSKGCDTKNKQIENLLINSNKYQGSPPGIYIKDSSIKTDPTKFLLYFQGGGWCYGDSPQETLKNCYERSQIGLGSSKLLAKQTFMNGIFSSNPTENPDFHDYTVVFLNYCDGSGFQGHLTQELEYNNSPIWFRGKQNVLTTLKYAKKTLQINQAHTVIVAGSSAGGLAVYTWLDFIAEDLIKQNPNIQVIGLPDAGFFLNQQSYLNGEYVYQTRMRNLLDISNAEQGYINKKCQKDNSDNPWKCMFAQYLLNYIQTPLLIVNSSYDSWSIPNIGQINCIKNNNLNQCSQSEVNYITEYHNQLYETVLALQHKYNNINAWVISCIQYSLLQKSIFNNLSWTVPENTEDTISFTTQQLLQQIKLPISYVDKIPWPQNQSCSNENLQIIQIKQ